MQWSKIYLNTLHKDMFGNQISIDPSPFLPQTTIAIEKVNIAAKAAQPNWKIIITQSVN